MRFLLLLAIIISSPLAVASMNVISANDLFDKNGITYNRKTNEPFSGRAVGKFYNGQPRSEAVYDNGIKDGEETIWYMNGKVRKKAAYKDGVRHGEWTTWDRDQRVLFHQNYQKGDRVY